MSFTVNSPRDLEIVLRQDLTAFATGEAPRVKLFILASKPGRRRSLEILAFDSSVATVAERAVVLVVMVLAVRLVVDHVEIRCHEGLLT